MASTGQIHFVRSRTVASEERELQKKQEESSMDEEAKVEEKPVKVETVVKKAPNTAPTVWVGRKRSDVTRQRYC